MMIEMLCDTCFESNILDVALVCMISMWFSSCVFSCALLPRICVRDMGTCVRASAFLHAVAFVRTTCGAGGRIPGVDASIEATVLPYLLEGMWIVRP